MREQGTPADIRQARGNALAAALRASRADTLATFAVYEQALQDPPLQVPQRDTLNPPLWELGHIGWFQAWWTTRNPLWREGARADPLVPRSASLRPGADALYNSSTVPHHSRWSLALPKAHETCNDLARQLDETLTLLARAGDDDDALYFFRLALWHEDMHHEAAVYMAQALAIDLPDARWQARAAAGVRAPLDLARASFELGYAGRGFAFDNELGAHAVDVSAYAIDSREINWREYLPFVESGGYGETQWWSEAGQQWRLAHGIESPRYLRRSGADWLQRCGSNWVTLDLELPACHLSFHEAQAWCHWAGRRLPSEAEWERAAIEHAGAFSWGRVWEWTASPFAPYPGFSAHPYRDYSAPWFDGRPVLRGASSATQPRAKSARYRNYFEAGRTDIVAGFRTCAV